MSEETSEAKPAEPTPLQACVREKMANGMSEEEATTACKAELEAKTEKPDSTAEKGFMDKLVSVFEESMDKKLKLWEQTIEKRLQELEDRAFSRFN